MELLRSTRLPYWRLNGPEGERSLEEMGLRPLTPLARSGLGFPGDRAAVAARHGQFPQEPLTCPGPSSAT